jgi:hypothetical protein
MTPRKEVPPIPPQCPYFVENNLQGKIFALPWPKTPVVRLDKDVNGKHVREIIACVAATYWRIELEATKRGERDDMTQTELQRGADRDQWEYECERNAASWLAWGGLAPQKGDGA